MSQTKWSHLPSSHVVTKFIEAPSANIGHRPGHTKVDISLRPASVIVQSFSPVSIETFAHPRLTSETQAIPVAPQASIALNDAGFAAMAFSAATCELLSGASGLGRNRFAMVFLSKR